MKFKELLLLSFCFITYSIYAVRPEDYSNADLKIRQMPDTEKLLKEYFSPHCSSDIIYAIIFPNANCPRGEAIIMPIINEIKRQNQNLQTVIISAYHDSISAIKYNSALDIKSDVMIYDTNNQFEKFLNFSIGTLHIPYFLKIDVSQGLLLTGFPAENNSSEFISDVIALNEPMEFHIFTKGESFTPYYRPSDKILNFDYKYPLNTVEDIQLSEIIYNPTNYNNLLAFNDKLRNAIEIFELNSEEKEFRHIKEVRTSEEENMRFVTAPDSLTNDMFENNEVKFIPLSPRFLSDGTLAISYSLPNIWQIGQWEVGYMNEPALLIVSPCDEKKRILYDLKWDLNDGFFEQHFQIFNIGNKIAMSSQKHTWPCTVDRNAYENIPEINPFNESFYNIKQPIISVFDYDGPKDMKVAVRIGNIPEISKKTLTGSYFLSPMVDECDSILAIADGISGQVCLYNESCIESPIKEYSIFEIDHGLLPSPDSSKFHTYECVVPFRSILCRHMQDLKLKKNKIFALIRYGEHGVIKNSDEYEIIVLDINNGNKNRHRIHKPKDSQKFMTVALWETVSDVIPYQILKEDGKWILESSKPLEVDNYFTNNHN